MLVQTRKLGWSLHCKPGLQSSFQQRLNNLMNSLNVQPQSNTSNWPNLAVIKIYADIVAGILRLKKRAWLNVLKWKTKTN